MTKLVVIDIGNTTISGAIYDGKRFIQPFRVGTHEKSALIKNYLNLRLKKFRTFPVIISGVVPDAGTLVKKILVSDGFKIVKIAGLDCRIPILNKYGKPKQVGVDRLMNAVAIHKRYKIDTLVIDFGTAITIDAVSKRGEYLGGVIAPGIELTLDALFKKTALLPKIKLKNPQQILGKDTVSSIRSGCSYGIGGLCDRLVDELNKELGWKAQVVATGGYAQFMKKYCHKINAIHNDLVFEGLVETYEFVS